MRRRVIQLKGVYNLRDLGGYPTRDGRVTQWGRVLRGGSLAALTSRGVAALRNRDVRTVIDLRTEGECAAAPSMLAAREGVNWLHLPIYRDGEDWAPPQYGDTGEVYVFWLRERSRNLAAVFHALAHTSTVPVLIGCSLGKDRTGLICAMLLDLADVDDRYIVADYVATERHLANEVRRWRAAAVDRGDDLAIFDRQVTPRSTDIQACLHYLREEHGGSEQYLISCGLDDGHTQRLRALLIASRWPA